MSTDVPQQYLEQAALVAIRAATGQHCASASALSSEDLQVLADAYILAIKALTAVRDLDRSEPYQEGEARPDGTVPHLAGRTRWSTPREIADFCLRGGQ